MPLRTPRHTSLLLVLLSLTACGPAPTSEPGPVIRPSAIVDPCDGIRLPARLDDPRRARLAAEIATAPPDAVWPGVLRDAAGIERAVRACQTPG